MPLGLDESDFEIVVKGMVDIFSSLTRYEGSMRVGMSSLRKPRTSRTTRSDHSLWVVGECSPRLPLRPIHF